MKYRLLATVFFALLAFLTFPLLNQSLVQAQGNSVEHILTNGNKTQTYQTPKKNNEETGNITYYFIAQQETHESVKETVNTAPQSSLLSLPADGDPLQIVLRLTSGVESRWSTELELIYNSQRYDQAG
jgi:hypothetical protein